MSARWIRSAIALVALVAMPRANAQVVQRADFVPLGPEATAAALDRPISISLSASLRLVLSRIAAQAALSLTFDDSLPGLDRMTVLNADRLSVRHALDRVLNGSPLQALVSLNEPIFVECSQALARKVLTEGGKTDEERITFAFRSAVACLLRDQWHNRPAGRTYGF